jgi:adenine-specific DNA-methyltransferase
MAGLFSKIPQRFRLLDPGAGAGALTAALCDRVMQLRTPRRLEVHLFENDAEVIDLLESTMRACRERLLQASHALTYQIHAEDFVLSSASALAGQRTLFDSALDLAPFDGVITNPPYFKVSKGTHHARVMKRVVHGQPNIYAFFLALAANYLRPGGELVAITPRSFCNGLYFRGFRQWFFERMGLEHIHLFDSRTDTFKEAGILQESVVTLTRRLGQPCPQVTVTRSVGRDLTDLRQESLSIATVLDETCGDMVVRIPETANDARILKTVESWPTRFAETGLRISTGPVVMFRTTRFLLPRTDGKRSVPLLAAHNIRPFTMAWPIKKRDWPVAFVDCVESQKHLVSTRNYVLIKRFTSKEERKRLVAGCVFAATQKYARLALENHLNYIYHAERELTDEETLGIAALFNSMLLDRYFRTISGNTQVNATEIRTMRFPDLTSIYRIGCRIRSLREYTAAKVEQIVLEELEIDGPIRDDLARSLN